MLMMVETVGMSMYKLSSGPINAAWALLKAPEGGLDERMLAQIFQNMPPELQERAHAVSQAMGQIDPEKASFMENQSKKLLEAHGLDNVLEQSHALKDPSMVRRSLPLDIIYEGRIAKFFPLVIGAIFVADAVLRSQGQKTSYIGATLHEAAHKVGLTAEGPDWAGTKEYADEASYIDPLGGKHGAIEDPTWYESLGMGVASGASALINPFALVGGGARAAGRASGSVGRAAQRGVGRGQQSAGRFVERLGEGGTAARQSRRIAQDTANVGSAERLAPLPDFASASARYNVPSNRLMPTRVPEHISDARRLAGQQADDASRLAIGEAERARKLGRYADYRQAEIAAGGLRGPVGQAGVSLQTRGAERIAQANRSAAERLADYEKWAAATRGTGVMGRANRLAGAGARTNYPWRAAQALSIAGAPQALAGLAATWGASQMPNVNPSTAGYSPHDSGGFGMANTGQGGGGTAIGHQVHGVTDKFGAQTKRQNIWEGDEWGQQYAKGENMKIGDRMLKELTDMMYKAKCPCGKTPCICKEYKTKKDDKKKPAHGMVIIIGSKAGPGPSTDGKRDKLDSEKDEKDE